jgi:hypothetical protein
MEFLNGLKTVIGAVGLVVSVAVPQFAPEVNAAGENIFLIGQGAFGLLLGLGLIHKGEKKLKR